MVCFLRVQKTIKSNEIMLEYMTVMISEITAEHYNVTLHLIVLCRLLN